MKSIIQEAGFGKHFSAHSIRGAASTAVHMEEMPISDVMNIVDWTSDNELSITGQLSK